MEEEAEILEELEEAKHEKVLDKLENMDKTLRDTKKSLTVRRADHKAMEEDHQLRLVQAKKNADYRRQSKLRAYKKH